MPTIFIIFGFVFKFFSNDHEPIHVYNVVPSVSQVYNHGFRKHELSIIEGIIEENIDVIIDRWHEFFKK